MRTVNVVLVVAISLMLLASGCSGAGKAAAKKQVNVTNCIPSAEEEGVCIPIEEAAPGEETPIVDKGTEMPLEDEYQSTPAPTKTEIPKGEGSTLPTMTVKEGEKVELKLKGTDADRDPLTYTFQKPFDRIGVWQTKVGDAGEYTTLITASDGKSEVTQEIRIVVQSLDKAPVIEAIKDIVVKEGETVQVDPKVSDPEGGKVSVVFDGWMTSNRKATGPGDAGEYTVTVTATDDKGAKTVKGFTVTVQKVNRAPILKSIPDVVVLEGGQVVVKAVAADPDGDKVTITYGEPLDSQGQWKTKVGDAGVYTAVVTASDGKLDDVKEVKMTVTALNKPPVVQDIAPITVSEGDTVKLSVKATDPENDKLTITYSGWMTSDTKKTDYDTVDGSKESEHTFDVTVTVSDGMHEVKKSVAVTVRDVNRPPVFCVEPFCK